MKGFIKIFKIYIMRFIMRLFYLFPIKDNRIIFNAYSGTQYACNPKYISEKLLEIYKGQFEIIWAFDKPEKYRFLEKSGIKLVKFYSLRRFFYEATAKISINNIGSFSWIPLRKGQEHVNTWHGFTPTCAGMDEPANDKLTRYSIGLSGKETTLFLSMNRLFSDYAIKVRFGYGGKVLNCGFPRSDVLLNGKGDAIRKNVRKKYEISDETVVVMYAPTWRYEGISAMPEMDYKELSAAMKMCYGDQYVIWRRMHHIIGKTESCDEPHLMDMTSYPDIEELIMASDILITDYSSVMWDAALRGNLVIQYAPDAEKYGKERGLYVPIGKWGAPVAYSMNELCDLIKKLDIREGHIESEAILTLMGNMETGHAAEICCEWIAAKSGVKVKTDFDYEKYLCDGNLIPDMAIINKMKAQ